MNSVCLAFAASSEKYCVNISQGFIGFGGRDEYGFYTRPTSINHVLSVLRMGVRKGFLPSRKSASYMGAVIVTLSPNFDNLNVRTVLAVSPCVATPLIRI